MNHLRQLFAAALAAGMLAFAPPTLAQDHAQVDGPAEQHEAVGLDGIADGGDEAADTSAPSDAEPAAEEAVVDDPDAAMADIELEETRSPWSTGLIMSITAMCIGGFSAVLGCAQLPPDSSGWSSSRKLLRLGSGSSLSSADC